MTFKALNTSFNEIIAFQRDLRAISGWPGKADELEARVKPNGRVVPH